jgi:hypothetical protein
MLFALPNFSNSNVQSTGTFALGGSQQFKVDTSGNLALNTTALTLNIDGSASFGNGALTIDTAGNLATTGTITGVLTAAGTDTQIQYNSGGAFAGSSNLTFDSTLNHLVVEGTSINPGKIIVSGDRTTNVATNFGSVDIYGGSNDPGDYSVLNLFNWDGTVPLANFTVNSNYGLKINGTLAGGAIDVTTNSHTWTFGADGGLDLPLLAAQPGTPVEGEIIYNSTVKNLQFYNGTAWTGVPVIKSVVSAPTISMSGTQSLAVTGLLLTSQIIAVSQNKPGAAGTLSLLGFNQTIDGFLNCTWVADPGIGGTVLVSFI